MLTEAQCPWTGPYGLPSSGLRSKGPTSVALKRAMSRLGHLPWRDFDEWFNQPLADALNDWDPGHAGYGKGRWEKLRGARIPRSLDHGGEYALDSTALDLIRQDWLEQHPPAPPYPTTVYPHELGWVSHCGGFLHPTGGIAGNWAYDFMAAPGTPVLAPEAGKVSRTSGHDPLTGLHGSAQDVFGWSVYLRCSTGFFYSTHYGKLVVGAGTVVRAGDLMGYVGDWPHDRPRSHTHLGFSSFTRLGAVSRRKIQAVAAAPRVTARPRPL